jgi:hypothetical protein
MRLSYGACAPYITLGTDDMRLMYYLLHVGVLLLFGVATYLAFCFLVPPYLIAVFGGYYLWQKMVEEASSRRIPRAALVGTTQALLFIPLAVVEFKLVGFPVLQTKEQGVVFAYLAALALAGYVMVAVAITVLHKQSAGPA